MAELPMRRWLRPHPHRVEACQPASSGGKRAARSAIAGTRQSLRSALRPPLAIPLLILLIGTLCFRLTGADLAIAGLFFDQSTQSWPWFESEPWHTLYVVGCYPAAAIGILGALPAIVSLVDRRWRAWRQPSLFLLIMLLLGPGLMVNTLLKPVWGRPRPCQVTEFGGDRPFVPVCEFHPHDDSCSFPCGHASMGFYLMAPAFLLLHRNRRAARAWFAVGVSAGFVMGLARIVQGRHFASDVLWAGALVYFSGVAAYYLMGLNRSGLPRLVGDADDIAGTAPSDDLVELGHEASPPSDSIRRAA